MSQGCRIAKNSKAAVKLNVKTNGVVTTNQCCMYLRMDTLRFFYLVGTQIGHFSC